MGSGLVRLDDKHAYAPIFDPDTGSEIGILMRHNTDYGTTCRNVFLWSEGYYKLAGPNITVAPAIRCSCGHKGFILDGKWEPYRLRKVTPKKMAKNAGK